MHDTTSRVKQRPAGWGIRSLDDLRAVMTEHAPAGASFLDFLLDGDFFEGKGPWVNDDPAVATAYGEVLAGNPYLAAESPYGALFDRKRVRVAGENDVRLSRLDDQPGDVRALVAAHRVAVGRGEARPRAFFAGGPAAKIGALLAATHPVEAGRREVIHLLDGAEQSNQSASAHYEHINHANALNAEHDNTGLAIALLAARRALFGEPDPAVALDVDYHKVDLWPSAFRLRDLPLFLHNEIHGRLQRLRERFGRMSDHDRSRIASRISTSVLSLVEARTGLSLRLPDDGSRALFLYLSEIEHRNSDRDHEMLARYVGIFPRRLTPEQIAEIYGPGVLGTVLSADVFGENHCIRHGLDRLCASALEAAGGRVLHRRALRELILAETGRDGARRGLDCLAVRFTDLDGSNSTILPVDRVCLSLGPTARYRFAEAHGPWRRICDRLELRQPVPRQIIATGVSAQLLFRISDPVRFATMPHTGLKQTHFVEVGRTPDLIVLKLTSGGNIGLPLFSRSHALGALANIFRILTPGCGLDFLGVVCAWPGTRGVNGPNNGQVVRLADNAAVRFGEGGTGMSKMGSNAQTLLDLVGIDHGLPPEATLAADLYAHTVLDRRRLVGDRLFGRSVGAPADAAPASPA